ncbi:MAG: hypothetical protein JWR39_2731 [Devosia sp.]|nr:hypothetical protein [Devosia sp.]
MTDICKQILTMLAFVLPLLVGGAAPAWSQSVNRTVVSDPLTGLALGGMDPVSYFTEAQPERGRSDFEYEWSGAPWQFSSAANRDAFARAPQIYAPQFGGHSAMSMARGFLSEGDPAIYAVFKQRLYLFYSAGSREAFLLAPDAAAREAERHWAVLSKTLSSR